MAISTVVVATDGSENSLRAAAFAGRLLAGHPEARVIIAHVAAIPPEYQSAVAHGLTPEIPLDAMVRRAAEPILAATAGALNLPPERVEEEVLVGRPAAEIIHLARAVRSDLIVCGRRGLTGLRELILGSVSNALVHGAPCPVLVVQ